ncbi:hypothetical protein [Rickettsiales endosymbiont of Stachyamoeba lipophora]|uniref:hypothetical protein n=1 Tax=Rickettsiales endosymbiont of Stachyamoeba lipophora TaxID=2486578 RepID=UPI000F645746|nr:hypothetical protein [Rickettsiales endosymbiont of Stachyamoeba lipophora]AZL15433.1 hypothetical protein EF513_02550 [Rickettsiales endosymbiont of Stachyamoeba lipophora]
MSKIKSIFIIFFISLLIASLGGNFYFWHTSTKQTINIQELISENTKLHETACPSCPTMAPDTTAQINQLSELNSYHQLSALLALRNLEQKIIQHAPFEQELLMLAKIIPDIKFDEYELLQNYKNTGIPNMKHVKSTLEKLLQIQSTSLAEKENKLISSMINKLIKIETTISSVPNSNNIYPQVITALDSNDYNTAIKLIDQYLINNSELDELELREIRSQINDVMQIKLFLNNLWNNFIILTLARIEKEK